MVKLLGSADLVRDGGARRRSGVRRISRRQGRPGDARRAREAAARTRARRCSTSGTRGRSRAKRWRARCSIPVIGGLGGGPWLDGRMRMAHAAIGYGFSNLGKPRRPVRQRRANHARRPHRLRRRRARRAADQGTTRWLASFSTASPRATRSSGDGPPLLMYAPGGFDATIEKWRAQGVYERIKLLEHLPKKYRCIAFDRRECGQSGGRVEQITWRALCRRTARRSRPPRHPSRAPHRRLHGLLVRDRVRGRVSRSDAEHDPVVAGRRRQVPHQVARSASPITWPSCGSTACRASAALVQQGRQAVQRRPARRAVGVADPHRSGVRRFLPEHESRGLQEHRRRACATRCSTAIPRRAPCPRTC